MSSSDFAECFLQINSIDSEFKDLENIIKFFEFTAREEIVERKENVQKISGSVFNTFADLYGVGRSDFGGSALQLCEILITVKQPFNSSILIKCFRFYVLMMQASTFHPSLHI